MPLTSPNLIDQLLADQQSLSVAERFSQIHTREREESPAQEKYYRDLIPLSRPGPGEQYAFEVNLDACTGCKACVVACHSLNGLDEKESWRDVGMITGGSVAAPVQQTVTSACHHCADPACMNGCPTLAYEKDEETGIVRHLDDQCIGCQYCVLKCPYDVPKYNDDLGIVRKCDMCYDRLKVGEAPACVQSCPSGAIQIKVVKQSAEPTKPQMIAGAFNSEYTKPTTTFRRKTPLPDNMVAADEQNLTPEHSHLPLVWMLTLTQTGAGLFTLSALLRLLNAPVSSASYLWMAGIGTLFALIGIGSSILHLGSPLGAWRAFLGLRRSWLSREIIIFGAWPPLAMLLVGLLTVKQNGFDLDFFNLTALDISHWVLPVTVACAGVSLLGVFCSVMVYADTHRDFWRRDRTLARFFGNLLIGGSAVSLAVFSITGQPTASLLYLTLGLGAAMRIGVEGLSLLPARQNDWSFAKKSALIQIVSLRSALILRWLCLIAGLALIVVSPVIGAILLLTGEWLARYLFFRAVAAPKMPGNLVPFSQ